jgi:hypothetical protein
MEYHYSVNAARNVRYDTLPHLTLPYIPYPCYLRGNIIPMSYMYLSFCMCFDE